MNRATRAGLGEGSLDFFARIVGESLICARRAPRRCREVIDVPGARRSPTAEFAGRVVGGSYGGVVVGDFGRTVRVSSLAGLLVAVGLTAGGCASTSGETELQGRVQRAVDGVLATRDIPGASVAVIDAGHLVVAVSGYADLERRQPIGADDEFRVASIAKTYLAALALDLDRDRVVRLDEPVGRWLPDLPRRLAFLRGATMRQLLSHTSGLAQTFTDDRDRGTRLTVADVLERIPAPVCDPGLCWSYADGNYVVAGVVIAAATGGSVSDETRARLLDPLGLADTHFIGEPGVEPLPSYVLEVDPVAFEPVEPHRLRRQVLPIVTDSRAAGMTASASDLARWAETLFTGGLIGKAAVEQMMDTSTMRDLPCPRGCPLPYGLGAVHYQVGDREFVGNDGSSGAIVATDLRNQLTIAILTNGGEQDTGAFLEAVVDAVTED